MMEYNVVAYVNSMNRGGLFIFFVDGAGIQAPITGGGQLSVFKHGSGISSG
jgi:hypothetical protein